MLKLTKLQKSQITQKLLSYGFFDFQIPALLQGKKILASWGHAKLFAPTELHVYKQYSNSTVIVKL